MDPVYKGIRRSGLKDIVSKSQSIRIVKMGSDDPDLRTKCQKVKVIKYHEEMCEYEGICGRE